jgi:hypothetical protein
MKLLRTSLGLALAVGLLAAPLLADEGMWTLNNFPKQLVKERYGFEPSDAWLDHVRLASVRYNNGGSGSFVSADGLTMTNHHVGLSCVQALSTAEHDYVATGFYAATREQELKCPGLELNQLVSLDDVTAAVNAGVTPGMTAAARREAQQAAIAQLEKKCAEETKLRCDVVTLYEGGVFNIYRYQKYTDVRLVFAPEQEIAFYGGDPDNFTYPRYDLDICFFRVYENDKPVHPEHFLKWNTKELKEGDVVFVSGHPGSTSRLQTVAQLEFLRDTLYPWILRTLKTRLDVLRAYSARGAEETRAARALIFSYENTVKAITGEHAGLMNPAILGRKKAAEQRLRADIESEPAKKKEYGSLWSELARAEKKYATFQPRYSLLEGSSGLRASRLFSLARLLVRMPVETAKPNEKRLAEYRESGLDSLKLNLFSKAPVYDSREVVMLTQVFTEMRDTLGPTDALVKRILAGRAPQQAAEAYVAGTKLQSVDVRQALADGGPKAMEESQDAMIALAKMVDPEARALRKRYEDEVVAVETANGARLARALFALRGTSIYPEATFTLRLSFGAAKGYVEDGRPRRWYTTFHGLYELNVGAPPYRLPARWLERKSALRFDTPFNFVTTNDITGGNSGSPVVDQNGELVGIVFDGNLQQLPNDYLYTEEQARTVAVHAAGIVEALRAIYRADAVLRELGQ